MHVLYKKVVHHGLGSCAMIARVAIATGRVFGCILSIGRFVDDVDYGSFNGKKILVL